METIYIVLRTCLGVQCYIFPEIYKCTQLCQTCALNHKPIKISTLNCILCDEKDSLQKHPRF